MRSASFYKVLDRIQQLPNKLITIFVIEYRAHSTRHGAAIVDKNARVPPFITSGKRFNDSMKTINSYKAAPNELKTTAPRKPQRDKCDSKVAISKDFLYSASESGTASIGNTSTHR